MPSGQETEWAYSTSPDPNGAGSVKAVLLILLCVMCRSDVAYFDGLNETILSVALVRPKPGLFSKLFIIVRNSLPHCLHLYTVTALTALSCYCRLS